MLFLNGDLVSHYFFPGLAKTIGITIALQFSNKPWYLFENKHVSR